MIAWWWLLIVFSAGVGFGAWLILWCRERAEDDAAALALDEGQSTLADQIRTRERQAELPRDIGS